MTALATVVPLFPDNEPGPDEICESAPSSRYHREDVRTVICGIAQLCGLCAEEHELACEACLRRAAETEDPYWLDEPDSTYGEW